MDITTEGPALPGQKPFQPERLPASPCGEARQAAAAALDAAYPADTETLVSFLVNALYLFGGQTLAAPDAPAAVVDELARQGHRIAAAAPEREPRRGPDGAKGAHPQGRQAAERGPEAGANRFDRIFLAGTFGREADPVGRLRALRRALRPGGLLCFQVLDRDRAWERTGIRAVGDAGPAGARVEFDPASGKLSARVIRDGGGDAAPAGPAAAVQTWNLGELKGLLRSAGLGLERAYGDWEGGGPGGAEGRLIVVASKPRNAARRRKAASWTAARPLLAEAA